MSFSIPAVSSRFGQLMQPKPDSNHHHTHAQPWGHGEIMAVDPKTGELKVYKGQVNPPKKQEPDDFHLLDRALFVKG